MDPRQQRRDQREQSEQRPEQQPLAAPTGEAKPETKTVCVVSHAAFGHYFAGYHLPRNKAVLIDIPLADFNNESQRPDSESPLGRQIAIHEGLLEAVDETDERFTGRPASEKAKGLPPAERAKRIETTKVCAYSRQPRGHYRARCYWPGGADAARAPIIYEVPVSMLKQIERDPNVVVLSPSLPDTRGQRHEQIPPGAVPAGEFFAELEAQQRREAEENSIYDRVVARRKEQERNRQHYQQAINRP